MIHAAMLGERWGFDGVFCHLPTSAVAEAGGEEGRMPGSVPGPLIAKCRIQAGSVWNAKRRDAAKSIPVKNQSQVPCCVHLSGMEPEPVPGSAAAPQLVLCISIGCSGAGANCAS